MRSKTRAGFTLIEVLVVCAIIGILVSILTLSFSSARMNSRDKVRMAELKELQLALEVYKAQNGKYPPMGCSAPTSKWVGPGPIDSSWGQGNCNDYISGLAPDYIAKLPTDPNQENDQDEGYKYRTTDDRSGYKVIILNSVETFTIKSQSDDFARIPPVPPCTVSAANLFPNQYAVYSPGMECL